MFKKIVRMLMVLALVLNTASHADLTDISVASVELENTCNEAFKSEKIYTLYMQLISLEKEKKYDEAIRLIDKIVHVAHNDLGRTSEHKRETVRNRFVSFLYVLQAKYNCELRRLIFAINRCDLALKYDETNAYAYLIKAYAYELSKNNEEAIKCIEISSEMGCKEARKILKARKERIQNIMLAVFEGTLKGLIRAFFGVSVY